jgi:hypothetical protein
MAVTGLFVRPWRGMTLWRSLAWQALDSPFRPRRWHLHHGSCGTQRRPRRDLQPFLAGSRRRRGNGREWKVRSDEPLSATRSRKRPDRASGCTG